MKPIAVLAALAVIAAVLYFVYFKKSDPAPAPAAGGSSAATEPNDNRPRTVLGQAYQHSKNTAENANDDHNAAIDAAIDGI